MDKIKDIGNNERKRSPKILMVDDKTANLIALEKVLKNEDAQLIKAASGNEALQLMLDHEFALALLDVQMPNMDGYELAEIMRSDSHTSDIPIVFISAIYTNKLNIFKGFEMGAFSFITKPFEPVELLNKVRFFLEKFETQQAYNDSRVKYMELYNSSPNMLFSLDVKTSNITDCNNAMSKDTGYLKQELIGKSIYDLCDLESIEKLKKILDQLNPEKKVQNIEIGILTKENQLIEVLLNAKCIKDDWGLVNCNFSLSDITELNRTKVKLEKAMADVEGYYEELKQFVYLTSHDLQEPILTVQSYIQFLRDDYGKALDDEGNKFIDFCLSSTTKMRKMLLSLLEFLRMGQVHDKTKVDFNALIQDVLIVLKEDIERSEAKINIGQLPVVSVNNEEIKILFMNLIGNALKFKKPKKQLLINVTAEKKDKFWKFIIADNGIGVDEIYFDKMFQMFKQLHKKGAYKGIGAGLPICKKIVESNGGKIWVESVVGNGTSINFTIPE